MARERGYQFSYVSHLSPECSSAYGYSTFLNELVSIAGTLDEGQGQLGRAKYKLAILYSSKNCQRQADACRSEALTIKSQLQPEADGSFLEEEFAKLCPWMLW